MPRVYSTSLSWSGTLGTPRMIPEQIPALGGTGIPPKGRTQRHSRSSDRDLFHIPLRGIPGSSPKVDPSRIPGSGNKAEAASPPAAPDERNSQLQALGSLRLNGLDLFADLLQRPPVQHPLPQHHQRRCRHRHGQSRAHETPEALRLQRGRAAAAEHSPRQCPMSGNARPDPSGMTSPDPPGMTSPDPPGMTGPDLLGMTGPDPPGITGPDPREFPALILQEFPAPIPQEFPAPIPREFPASIPREFPAPIPQEFPAPIPWEFPASIPR